MKNPMNKNLFSPTIAGYLFVVISALSFASNNAFAVIGYRGGSTPLSLLTFRSLFALIALTLIIKSIGAPISLPTRQRNIALGLGILNALLSLALMSSFAHAPIGLAVLVFYLFPILTGVSASALGQEKLTKSLIFGLIGCFIGLLLTIEINLEKEVLFGLVLAGIAAFLMTAINLISARVLNTGNVWSVTLHIHISATILLILITIITTDFSLPVTTSGWGGVWGAAIFYTVAITAYFAAIARIGAIRSGLVMNLEPVGSIVLGFVWLSQILTLRQLIGAAIVICTVSALKWFEQSSK